MNPVAKMTSMSLCYAGLASLSMLNRLVLHGRVIGAAWWQRGVWLIGRVVATWCLVAFWKQAIFCVVLSTSVHLKLTSALSYSCAIMWTQGFWRQCIKSKRVLMAYYRENLAIYVLIKRWRDRYSLGKFLRGLLYQLWHCSSFHAVLCYQLHTSTVWCASFVSSIKDHRFLQLRCGPSRFKQIDFFQ